MQHKMFIFITRKSEMFLQKQQMMIHKVGRYDGALKMKIGKLMLFR